MIWLLIGYMWLEIHRPYEIWKWLAAYRVERVYVIFTIICWLLSGARMPPANRLNWCFSAFIVVMLASWSMSPYGDGGSNIVENYLKSAVLYVLLVSVVRNERDLRRMLGGYLAVMALWMLHSLREFHIYHSGVWAQGLLRLCPVGVSNDFNDFAGYIVCSLPFAWALWRYWTDWRRRALLGGYVALAAYCVVLTGSRMGFFGMVLTGILVCMASPYRWRFVAIYPVVMLVAWAVLPEGVKDRYRTLLDPDYKSVHGATSAGTYRYEGLERGAAMLEERPLLGYGPGSFGKVATQGMMAHNLYGQLLGELGVAGVLAFAAIIAGAVGNLFAARRLLRIIGDRGDPLPRFIVAAVVVSFVVLLVMAWGFNFLFWSVWLWFGGFQVVSLQLMREQADEIEREQEELEYA